MYFGCLDMRLDLHVGCLDLYLGVWNFIFGCLDLYPGYCTLVVSVYL